jgi:peptidoglycan/LPS O-acetylase OafA/YrhL
MRDRPAENLPGTHRSTHRFSFVDGLRGLAALGVAALHVTGGAATEISPTASAVVGCGYYGVLVFFVISGFVIAHSLSRTEMTTAAATRFLLRRVARLDPPYWASMALVVIVLGASVVVLPGKVFELPSPGLLLAHLLYLQYILGMESLCGVYWTLCLELQFYVLLALLIGLAQRAARTSSERVAFALVFGPPLAASFLFACHFVALPRGACFAQWYAFAAGVAASRVVAGRGYAALVVAAAVALAVAVITRTGDGLVVAGTAGAIALAHRTRRLDRWLAGPTVQYLGRISYSLYLVHVPIGFRLSNLLNHVVPASPPMHVATAVIGLLAAIAAADVFWRLVERPSLELSRWLGARLAAPTAFDGRPSPLGGPGD